MSQKLGGLVESLKKRAIGVVLVVKRSEKWFLLHIGIAFFYYFFETYSKHLGIGVFVIQPPNQNFSVLPPLIPVEAHALVSVRAVAVIRVLSSVIQDPVHHVELLHVPNVTVP